MDNSSNDKYYCHWCEHETQCIYEYEAEIAGIFPLSKVFCTESCREAYVGIDSSEDKRPK